MMMVITMAMLSGVTVTLAVVAALLGDVLTAILFAICSLFSNYSSFKYLQVVELKEYMRGLQNGYAAKKDQ